MYTKPIILPLDSEGKFYVIQDENGKMIGTGTREVCETLMGIINRQTPGAVFQNRRGKIPQRPNVRAAIEI